MARTATNKLLQMLEDGYITYEAVVGMCLDAMSEDDVAQMMDANELTDRFQEWGDEWPDDEEHDGQPDEAQEWADFDQDC